MSTRDSSVESGVDGGARHFWRVPRCRKIRRQFLFEKHKYTGISVNQKENYEQLERRLHFIRNRLTRTDSFYCVYYRMVFSFHSIFCHCIRYCQRVWLNVVSEYCWRKTKEHWSSEKFGEKMKDITEEFGTLTSQLSTAIENRKEFDLNFPTDRMRNVWSIGLSNAEMLISVSGVLS